MELTASSSRISFLPKFKLPWRSKEKSGTSQEVKKPVQYRLQDLMKATNNFSNENEIGRGGYGVVYKGMIDGQMVAVKKLLRSSVNTESEESDIKKEIYLLSSLKNDNLVMLLGFCYEAGEYILVYEFVANGDIRQFLKDENKRRTLDWQTRFRIIKGFAKGLCYLHHYMEKKIIHCDVKPENVLLDKDNNAKIADFGLSKIVDLSKSHITALLAGTPGYIAPEIWYQKQYSTKSDIYSFGILILEIVVGCSISHYAEANEETLTHAVWKQWNDMRPLEEMTDTCLRGKSPQQEVSRCVHIGLLCVQHYRNRRPSMELVMEMLNSDFDLRNPSFPGFFQGRGADQGPSHEDSDSDEHEHVMVPKIYRLKDLEIATNKFSNINRLNVDLGYEVYTGTLDGRKVYIQEYSLSSDKYALKFVMASIEKNITKNRKVDLLLPNMRHPNVLRIFGYCSKGECSFILICEHPRRGTLAKYLNRSNDVTGQSKRDLDFGTRLKIIKGLANGLCYLHHSLQNKIIFHLNLNRSNILLDDDWNAKISDYNLAMIKDVDDDHHLELDDYNPRHEHGYAAPELLMRSFDQLGDLRKSDVYSFGVIMLEMLVAPRWHSCCVEIVWLHWEYMQMRVWQHSENVKIREMIDPFLDTLELEEQEQLLRFFQIGLLCVQRDPNVRPNAQEIVQMLSNNNPLPIPTDPRPLEAKSPEYSGSREPSPDLIDPLSPQPNSPEYSDFYPSPAHCDFSSDEEGR